MSVLDEQFEHALRLLEEGARVSLGEQPPRADYRDEMMTVDPSVYASVAFREIQTLVRKVDITRLAEFVPGYVPENTDAILHAVIDGDSDSLSETEDGVQGQIVWHLIRIYNELKHAERSQNKDF